jgi:hypothetical protein
MRCPLFTGQQLDRDVRRDGQAERFHSPDKAAHQTPQWRQRVTKEDTLQLGEIRCPKASHGVPTLRRLSNKNPPKVMTIKLPTTCQPQIIK